MSLASLSTILRRMFSWDVIGLLNFANLNHTPAFHLKSDNYIRRFKNFLSLVTWHFEVWSSTLVVVPDIPRSIGDPGLLTSSNECPPYQARMKLGGLASLSSGTCFSNLRNLRSVAKLSGLEARSNPRVLFRNFHTDSMGHTWAFQHKCISYANILPTRSNFISPRHFSAGLDFLLTPLMQSARPTAIITFRRLCLFYSRLFT